MFERVVTTLALVFCIIYSAALMRDGTTPVGLVWFLGVGTGIWFINTVDAYKNRA